jgi:NodT family efflux transporter outer membrane factor (OMF) lipoprotein
MRSAVPITALACAALALGACADARLRKPDVTLPGAFEAPPGAGDPALSAARLDRWWTLFPDPQLQTLVEQALASAPDARTAQARLEEAVATRRGRIAGLLPQGELQGSASEQHVERSGDFGFTGGGGAGGGAIPGFSNSGDTQSLSLSLNPTWELDLFGRLRQGRRFANADFAASRFNVEASRMSLAAQVAQGLFLARSLAVQLEDARESARIAGELARVGRIRAERGLGPAADAARFQSTLDTAEAEIVRIAAALDAQKRTLLVLLGRGTDPLGSLVVEARADPAPKVPASTPGELLARRPDVREAEARLTAQAANVSLDRLALFPKFTLAPGVSLSRSYGATESSTTIWSLGLNAAVPLLDRPRLLAELRAEKARGEQAVIAYEKAVQTAYGEAENALVQLAADRRRVALLSAGEARAERAYQASARGYQAGLIDLQTTLNNEQAWRAVRTQETSARVQALRRAVQTYKALGGGWPAQSAPTNKEAR